MAGATPRDATVVMLALALAVATAPGQGALVVVKRSVTGADTSVGVVCVDGNGARLWPENGVVEVSSGKLVSGRVAAVSDQAQGVIVFFAGSSGPDELRHIFAQRVDAGGVLLWNSGQPLPVSDDWRSDENPVVVTDGSGGAVVVYEQYPSLDRSGTPDVDLCIQRVRSSGVQVWGAAPAPHPLAVTAAAERNPALLADSAGGAIVAYEYEPRSGDNAGDVDIHARRVGAGGEQLWLDGSDGVVVGAVVARERNPAIAADGYGGAVVAYDLARDTGEYAGDHDILAQRLSSSGVMVWNSGERSSVVATSKHQEVRPRVLTGGPGEPIVVFEVEFVAGDDAGDLDVWGQRLSSSGEQAWLSGDKSVPVAASKWRERRPVLLSDGAGGFVVITEDEAVSGKYAGQVDIDARRFDGSGAEVWDTTGKPVPVAAEDWAERQPSAAVDADAAVIVAWQSRRDGGRSVAVRRLGMDGTLLWKEELRIESPGSSYSEPLVIRR